MEIIKFLPVRPRRIPLLPKRLRVFARATSSTGLDSLTRAERGGEAEQGPRKRWCATATLRVASGIAFSTEHILRRFT